LPDDGISLAADKVNFDPDLTHLKVKCIGYVGQNGLWVLSDIEKIYRRRDKPKYGRTPKHQAFWQSMSDKETDA
tara:strand:- start:438 stop:659 length:222 start_codon:yes stop_codon:yes gene_type:complete